MVYAGIDEAGLGPVLGPYCAGLALFESPREDIYSLLAEEISRSPEKGRTAVGDSKKLYTPAKGLEELEKSVLTFYSLLYGRPENFGEFIGNLTKDNLSESPWFSRPEELTLPIAASHETVAEGGARLEKAMAGAEVSLIDIKISFITAHAFNRGLDRTGNKGALCQELLHPLMERALGFEDLLLTVDRQGGRRFYGDWLISLLPGRPLQAMEERAKQSVYRSGSRTIQFLVGGDGFALETALSSLFAKYARECGMILFNRYWQEKGIEIKETAGYYSDGMRFVGELEKAGLLPDDRDSLIRKK